MIKILEQGEPITSEDIREAENRLNIIVPEPYLSFLLKNNGGRPDPSSIDIEVMDDEVGVAWFFAVRDKEKGVTIEYNLEIIREGYPHKHVIPVASDSSGGIFCLDTEEGKGLPVVYFEWGGAWQDEPYEPICVAPDFNTFLDMIHE